MDSEKFLEAGNNYALEHGGRHELSSMICTRALAFRQGLPTCWL